MPPRRAVRGAQRGVGVFVPLASGALAFGWGIVGVWCAVLALMGMRLATLGVRFAGGRWALVGAAT